MEGRKQDLLETKNSMSSDCSLCLDDDDEDDEHSDIQETQEPGGILDQITPENINETDDNLSDQHD